MTLAEAINEARILVEDRGFYADQHGAELANKWWTPERFIAAIEQIVEVSA